MNHDHYHSCNIMITTSHMNGLDSNKPDAHGADANWLSLRAVSLSSYAFVGVGNQQPLRYMKITIIYDHYSIYDIWYMIYDICFTIIDHYKPYNIVKTC